MLNYEKMLDRLYLSLPKGVLTKERFVVPKVESFLQGRKTIFKNFAQLTKDVRRETREMYKYFTKELAVPMNIESERLVINAKFLPNQLQVVFENYAKSYVLCHECQKPDTHYLDRNGVKVLKCEACGATSKIQPL